MNKYIVLVNLDSILREKCLESYLKDNYSLIYSDDKSLGFRLGDSKFDKDTEFNYIKASIQILKRVKIKKVITLDITEEMDKGTGKLTMDHLFIKRIEQKAIKELVK